MRNPETKIVGVSRGQKSRHPRYAPITSRGEQSGRAAEPRLQYCTELNSYSHA